jgi:anaerobic magnesium-protoporphyrin IX monomethyl ester cyclase
MAKILLVSPPYQRLRGMASNELPLGLLYLAAALGDLDAEVKVLNLEEAGEGEHLLSGYVNAFNRHRSYLDGLHDLAHPAWVEYLEVLESFQPEMIGFSVMTPSYPLALQMAREARARTGSFILFGGPHATLCPGEVAAEPSVDAVMIGEGEIALKALVNALRSPSGPDLRSVPSLAYRDGERVHFTPLEPLVPDLDALPFPEYRSLHRPGPAHLASRFGVVTGRGCPYRCTFCVDHRLWRDSSRFRSPENVLEEIAFLRADFGMERLFFQQDSFLNNRQTARAIARGMVDRGLAVPWWCAARIDQIEEELLTELKDSGLDAIILGIESGSPRILEIMGKRITPEDTARAVHLIKKHGIRALGFFMAGIPDETEEDLRMTMDLIRRLPLDYASLSVFTPLPGSILFQRCRELGLLQEKVDWSRFDYQSPENRFCANIEPARFSELVREASELVDRVNGGG